MPRCVLPQGDVREVEFHLFCDASEATYGAVIYSTITTHQEQTEVQLIMSKTRVAPVKAVSLPRLELCAAQLGTKLLSAVLEMKTHLQLKFTFHAWTDSTVVLQWLSQLPRTWTTFVANRVSFVQDLLPEKGGDMSLHLPIQLILRLD